MNVALWVFQADFWNALLDTIFPFFPPKGKKGKDPAAPKRPMSAYMLWLNASREKIKGDNPGISIIDLSKKAGEIWKGMSKDKKEVKRRVYVCKWVISNLWVG